MTLPKDLEGRLRDTKTFNYNVYGGVDAFDNSISFEEALDEIATLIEAYTEDRVLAAQLDIVHQLMKCVVADNETVYFMRVDKKFLAKQLKSKKE